MLFTFTAQAYVRDPIARPVVLAPTGIDDLDHLPGGIGSGDVWVLAGAARSERSMLCVQLASALAAAGSSVRFFLGRDPIQETVARFSAHTRAGSLFDVRSTLPHLGEPWATWALDFVPRPESLRTEDWDVLPVGGPCCLVIDDLDLWGGEPAAFLPLARSYARREGCAVVITVPEYVLGQGDPATWQQWVRGSDVIMSVASQSDGYSTIQVLSHRAGPIATLDTYGHFEGARFETPQTAPRSVPPTAPQGDGAAWP